MSYNLNGKLYDSEKLRREIYDSYGTGFYHEFAVKYGASFHALGSTWMESELFDLLLISNWYDEEELCEAMFDMLAEYLDQGFVVRIGDAEIYQVPERSGRRASTSNSQRGSCKSTKPKATKKVPAKKAAPRRR